ncbi:MAG TPA: hypothetical protein VFV87_12260 [Pirellulaceae bacterium]|nr:hypothetical protein [Pirellulaceae bacterium]
MAKIAGVVTVVKLRNGDWQEEASLMLAINKKFGQPIEASLNMILSGGFNYSVVTL